MLNMQFIRFAEYAKFAEDQAAQEEYGQFGWHEGHMVKRHAGYAWRPIRWCDRCKVNIEDGLFFDQESRTALCPVCATGGDKTAFASIGIIFDG